MSRQYKHHVTSKREHFFRCLKLESLENRRLLAADMDFAPGVSGTQSVVNVDGGQPVAAEVSHMGDVSLSGSSQTALTADSGLLNSDSQMSASSDTETTSDEGDVQLASLTLELNNGQTFVMTLSQSSGGGFEVSVRTPQAPSNLVTSNSTLDSSSSVDADSSLGLGSMLGSNSATVDSSAGDASTFGTDATVSSNVGVQSGDNALTSTVDTTTSDATAGMNSAPAVGSVLNAMSGSGSSAGSVMAEGTLNGSSSIDAAGFGDWFSFMPQSGSANSSVGGLSALTGSSNLNGSASLGGATNIAAPMVASSTGSSATFASSLNSTLANSPAFSSFWPTAIGSNLSGSFGLNGSSMVSGQSGVSDNGLGTGLFASGEGGFNTAAPMIGSANSLSGSGNLGAGASGSLQPSWSAPNAMGFALVGSQPPTDPTLVDRALMSLM